MDATAELQAKRAAAMAGAGEVKEGMTVALGSGSTAVLAIQALHQRFPSGGHLRTVASSSASETLARSLGFAVERLAADMEFDMMLDGADEVTPTFAMTKGGGGALFREKFLARLSRQVVIMVDRSKFVNRLGERHAIPVEVVPFARPVVADRIARDGFAVRLRLDKETSSPFRTDNGNEILDLQPAQPLADPEATERSLASVPGVVESGIFVDLAHRVFVGEPSGSATERRPVGPTGRSAEAPRRVM